MVITAFLVNDQVEKIRFFKETFLVVNISPNVIFGMLFFTLNNANVDFSKKKLWEKFYTIEKAFFTIKQVKLIGKKEFIVAALNLGHETFIIPLVFLDSPSNDQESDVYFSCKAQIAALVVNETSILISTEYLDFINIFSPKLILKLFEYIGINDYAIKLIDEQQPLYKPIYSLGPVKLKILKIYIKINLANNFI